MQSSYDVIIVGARAAGAATALLLARQGRRVLVVERGQYGTDTLSTHALMRGAVLQLHRWGLLDRVKSRNTPVARTTSFHYADEEIEIPIKVRDGVDGLYAPRRYVLDALLEDAAREAGAEFVHGARLTDLLRRDDGRVTGAVVEQHGAVPRRLTAELVIGADGYQSTVARLVGARAYEVGRHRGAVVYAYWSGLAVSGYHWYFRPGVSGGAIPTNDGQVCVFAAMSPRRFTAECCWRRLPPWPNS
jgi:flavin-dependent dehydrogenase